MFDTYWSQNLSAGESKHTKAIQPLSLASSLLTKCTYLFALSSRKTIQISFFPFRFNPALFLSTNRSIILFIGSHTSPNTCTSNNAFALVVRIFSAQCSSLRWINQKFHVFSSVDRSVLFIKRPRSLSTDKRMDGLCRGFHLYQSTHHHILAYLSF